MACVEKEIPFSSQTDHELKHISSGKHITPFKSKDIETFSTQINNRINENLEENSKISLYYDMNEFSNLETTKTQFSLTHLNISSLQYHFEELDDYLNTSKTHHINVIGIIESRLKKGISPLPKINLQNSKIEPTESEKGGSLLYISSDLNYKVRNGLKMFKSIALESVFIEIKIKGKEKNIIIRCIYKHSKLPIEEFHYQFFSAILEKVSFENKDIYLLGDFNINLLNYESDRHTCTLS